MSSTEKKKTFKIFNEKNSHHKNWINFRRFFLNDIISICYNSFRLMNKNNIWERFDVNLFAYKYEKIE